VNKKNTGGMPIRKSPSRSNSRLLRVITRLDHLSDPEEIAEIQQRLDRMHLRHSVCCRSGRLELMADLIAAGKDRLKKPEKKALALMARKIENEQHDRALFLDFSKDYLLHTIADSTVPDHPCRPGAARKHYAGKTVAALSLTGLVMAGCTQQKSCVQALPLKKETAGPVWVKKGSSRLKSNPEPVLRALDPVQEKAMHSSGFYPYLVQPGDSLKKIAEKAGLDPDAVARLNNIRYDQTRNWYVLHPGQKLLLEKTGEPAKTALTEKSATGGDSLTLKKPEMAGADLIHFVTRGDSLWKIAKKYRVPIQAIAAANHIRNPEMIRYGSTLKIPGKTADEKDRLAFHRMNRKQKIDYIRRRTIKAGRQYVDTIVEMSEAYAIDPRLYASLIWEESWFDSNARSSDNCRKLAQLDPRFHEVSRDIRNNFRKSLGYLRHEFVYYRQKGFDKKASALCALAAYNGGDTRIRRLIRNGEWDGQKVDTIPIPETREHLKKILRRCENNYQAVL